MSLWVPCCWFVPFISFIGMIVCLSLLYYAYIIIQIFALFSLRNFHGGVTAIVTWGTPESASW